MTSTSTPARSYVVSGMTCEHCVLSVTEEVAEVAGVDAVSVDLASGVVTVTGDSFTDADVQAAVGEAGYEVVS
jgi:copper chaperone CopZ